MSIRFNVRAGTLLPTQGRILIRPISDEDWSLAKQPTQRFADRGSLTDPAGEVEDWGRLPSATV